MRSSRTSSARLPSIVLQDTYCPIASSMYPSKGAMPPISSMFLPSDRLGLMPLVAEKAAECVLDPRVDILEIGVIEIDVSE